MRLVVRRVGRLDNMITFKSKGNFEKTTLFFKRIQAKRLQRDLIYFAEKGLSVLEKSTPIDTGETASSWYYEITNTKSGIKIVWKNSNLTDGTPVAVLIQYGHVTRNGGYYPGVDYINPAIKPIADEVSEYIRKELCTD